MSVIYAAFTATHINMLTYCYFIYLHTYWHYLLFCLPYIPSRSYCHSLFTVNIVCVDCCVLLCIVVIVMLTETVDKGHTAGGFLDWGRLRIQLEVDRRGETRLSLELLR